MPVTYTNRKGVAYTLYRTIGVDGKPRYVFGRRSVGEPVDEMPPGFRVSESPNGIVSVARDRPALIQLEEIAAVEREIKRHPKAKNYRVAGKHKRIEIYAKIGPDVVDVYHEMLASGLVPPGREQQMQEVDEQFAQFSPVLCFTLVDPVRRTFLAEEFSTWGGIHEWLDMGQWGDIAALAGAIVPTLSEGALPGYTTNFQPGIEMRPPSAAGRGRNAMTSRKRAAATDVRPPNQGDATGSRAADLAADRGPE